MINYVICLENQMQNLPDLFNILGKWRNHADICPNHISQMKHSLVYTNTTTQSSNDQLIKKHLPSASCYH